MGAIPAVASTRGLRSSAFDRHQEQEMKRKQLLPKDLAARAEKVDPAKVEAEVLRIISAKPAALSGRDPGFIIPGMGQILQAGSIVPPDAWQQAQARMAEMERQAPPDAWQQAQARMAEMERQARQLEQAYMGDMQQQQRGFWHTLTGFQSGP